MVVGREETYSGCGVRTGAFSPPANRDPDLTKTTGTATSSRSDLRPAKQGLKTMFAPLRCIRPAPRPWLHNTFRCYAQSSSADVRAQLTTELKSAMKTKNTTKSSVIRSVLTEVYAADKTGGGQPIGTPRIYDIVRKAIKRRNDAAAQYVKASREDLAQTEREEVSLLQDFMPASMSDDAIDGLLSDIIQEQSVALAPGGKNQGALIGKLMKAFFEKVDDSGSVDRKQLKDRIDLVLNKLATPSSV